MIRNILVATFTSCLFLVPVARAQDRTAIDTDSATGRTATAPATCDLKTADRWGQAAQAAVDRDPAKHTGKCPEVAAYAAAAAAAKASDLPQPCAAFATLAQDRVEVARYDWAYRSVIEVLVAEGKTERAERIRKALALYDSQFAEYDGKVRQFSELCQRVHSSKASASDVTTWSQSGKVMAQSVKTGRSTVWDKGGVKASLDSSFKSVAEALK